MKLKLLYNPATGVWYPAPELRPVEHQFANAQPLLRNRPVHYGAQIPPMPAVPLSPHVKMQAPDPNIRGPQYGRIPNQPVVHQAQIAHFSAAMRNRAKYGSVTLSDTMPTPDILPSASLPNIAKFNPQTIRNEQARIENKILSRGGQFPASTQWYTMHDQMMMDRRNQRGRNGQATPNSLSDHIRMQRMGHRGNPSRIKVADLGMNLTHGSNSNKLSFGSHLGRSVGSPL